jgi:hypothetical protein
MTRFHTLALTALALYAAPANADPAYHFFERSLSTSTQSPLPDYSGAWRRSPQVVLPPAIGGKGPIYIRNNRGGSLRHYQEWIRSIRSSGRRVVIDGTVDSAAALLMTLPPSQVCVTPRARFRVHEAWVANTGRVHPVATMEILNSYPAAAREIIRKRGGLTRKLITIPARAIFAACR